MRIFSVPYLGSSVPMLLSDAEATARGIDPGTGLSWPPDPSPVPSDPTAWTRPGTDEWLRWLAPIVVDRCLTGTITRTSTGAVTSAPVVWPDGATGALTGTPSGAAPGTLDRWTVTYVPAVGSAATVTQPLVTRDSSGGVTIRPALTITRS